MTRDDDATARRLDELSGSGVELGRTVAGKFRLEAVVGSGGMGVVFKAWHTELEEHVALKFLLPSRADDDELRRRFALEAKAAAKLRGEHVVRIHDVGTLDGHLPFIVMEYLDGRTVGALVRERGPLPLELACSLTIQACDALAEAHALGIVHRDVKPENLVVTLDRDDTPRLRVVDFGISKVALALEPARTNPGGTVRGTPYSMSPEQLEGTSEPGSLTDVWSLGAVLFEMLAGRQPFGGKTFAGLASEILTQPPRQLRKLRFDAPEELERVVNRCLAKRPEDRFASVAELAAALEPFAPAEAHVVAERARRIVASSLFPAPARPTGSALDDAILSAGKVRARPVLDSPWRYAAESHAAAPGSAAGSQPPKAAPSTSEASPAAAREDLEATQAGARGSLASLALLQSRRVLVAATFAGLILASVLASIAR